MAQSEATTNGSVVSTVSIAILAATAIWMGVAWDAAAASGAHLIWAGAAGMLAFLALEQKARERAGQPTA